MNFLQPQNHTTPTLESIVYQVSQDLGPQFEEKLRSVLDRQDKTWLMNQLIRLTLNTQRHQSRDRITEQEKKAASRAERVARLRDMRLNVQILAAFLERYPSYDRARLVDEGYLLLSTPPKGSDLIAEEHRTAKGQILLGQAKDILFGLLFGDDSTHTSFERSQRELLTITLPRFKAHTLDFMKASTEFNAAGTWQDPENVAHDARADNVILEIEFGEIDSELIGNGIVRCLSLINNLEVNEQLLYARMMDVEQSTLIE